MYRIRRVLVGSPVLMLLLLGCSSSGSGGGTAVDAGVDPGLPGDLAGSGDVTVSPGDRVAIDLAPYLEGGSGPGGGVSVRRSNAASDLLGGEAATGRKGDWILSNDVARFVVEDDRRVIGVCPYGGTLIDADVVRPDGEPGQDEVGEVCLFLNFAFTLDPERYDVIADGQGGGAGILAVTGRLQIHDFVNLRGLISAFVPGIDVPFPFDTDRIPPLTVTVYYLLEPGARTLRVLTAIRNDGQEVEDVATALVIDSGGNIEYFNPLSARAGFGNRGSLKDLRADALLALAFVGRRGSYAVFGDDEVEVREGMPVSGSYVVISGVVVVMLGSTNAIQTLLTPRDKIREAADVLHLQPGEVAVRGHRVSVGVGSVSSTFDEVYRLRAPAVGTVAGQVRDPAGTGIPGVRVSAVDDTLRAWSQAVTDGKGRYAMDLPPGAYTITGWKVGHPLLNAAATDVASAKTVAADVVLGPPGLLVVQVRRPDGTPTPAKVTVSCDGDCLQIPSAADQDLDIDRPPGGVAAIVFTGMDGLATIPVAPGSYRVAASRGMEWSVWPPDAVQTEGAPVAVGQGQTVKLDAEIARVVDTTGAMSGDFHVHAINSPDSPIPLPDRVRSFLGEGVDVLVGTDHAYITDYAPVIEKLGAAQELVSIVGEELTTFDYGHYNGFPLQRDPESPNGGAYDWAGGTGPGHTPAEIFAWMHGQPGEQVVQVNHPASGYVAAVRADVLRGITFADPVQFRLPATVPDPITGDTGLWSEDFTAMEILNGNSLDKFWHVARWWFTFLDRGFTPTATAVSDTHKSLRSQAGGPRSFVFVPPGRDTPGSFDEAAFVSAVNDGRLIGTNGPFFRVRATNAKGEVATLGEVLRTDPGVAVDLQITIDVPEWMLVDTVEIYANIVDDVQTTPGRSRTKPLPPSASIAVDLSGEALQTVVEGAVAHRHRTTVVTLPWTVSVDTWLMVLVRGKEAPGMFPVIHNRSVRPFAFSNPIYLDADGNGYDHPPLAEEAAQAWAPPPIPARPRRLPHRAMSPEDLRRILDRWVGQHEGF